MYKISGSWSRYMLNFDFLKKGLGLASPPHFVYDFSWCSINWANFTDWLPLLLGILGKMWVLGIIIICFPVYDVINLKLTLAF